MALLESPQFGRVKLLVQQLSQKHPGIILTIQFACDHRRIQNFVWSLGRKLKEIAGNRCR